MFEQGLRQTRESTPSAASLADHLDRQLRGIAAFHALRQQHSTTPAGASREQRLDAARLADMFSRAHGALIERTGLDLLGSGGVLFWPVPRRVVLVTREEWFREQISKALVDSGLEVIARLDNGADALGVVAAEQPDLLVLDRSLPMLSGEQLIRWTGVVSPGTRTAAKVTDDREIAPALAAGATTAFSRRVPAAQVAVSLRALVTV
ncbi:MAG: DNA-binding response regulator [Frankiales bacterium]|nr:DNA-binding response regulator [Frankiales bacterium]